MKSLPLNPSRKEIQPQESDALQRKHAHNVSKETKHLARVRPEEAHGRYPAHVSRLYSQGEEEDRTCSQGEELWDERSMGDSLPRLRGNQMYETEER